MAKNEEKLQLDYVATIVLSHVSSVLFKEKKNLVKLKMLKGVD